MTGDPLRPLVLVVDDVAYNRDILVQNLEDEFALREAADGLAGLRIALEEQPDVILMDLRLPDVDGFEITQRLRKDPRTAWIPIVAVTAHAMAGADVVALASGCDDYLAKPLDEELLLVKVREWVARGRSRR
jgi:two-component system cell cycle response regulator DivK